MHCILFSITWYVVVYIFQGSRLSQAAAALHEFKFICADTGISHSNLYWMGRVLAFHLIINITRNSKNLLCPGLLWDTNLFHACLNASKSTNYCFSSYCFSSYWNQHEREILVNIPFQFKWIFLSNLSENSFQIWIHSECAICVNILFRSELYVFAKV